LPKSLLKSDETVKHMLNMFVIPYTHSI